MSRKKQKDKKKATSNKKPEQLTMKNVWPGKNYKVVSTPAWWSGNCRFVGQIGECQKTDSVHGATLKFPAGEIVTFPLIDLEFVDKKEYITTEEKKPMIPAKDKSYRVIKKPKDWKSHCKFLNQVGICILIDDRGVRLRFPNGADLSFQPDEIEESEPIDLNSLKSAVELNENSVVVGNLYRVIKKPAKFGKEADRLVGMVGKAKWANYRGICLLFKNDTGYVFDFDGIEPYFPPIKPNPIIIPKMLNANSIVIGREYKIIKVDESWTLYEKGNILNKMGKVKFASDISHGAMMMFPNCIEKFMPFDYIQDLPRPTEDELIQLIKSQPGRILKVIKALNKITRLKPVMDFVEKGDLPSTSDTEVMGPHIPPCFSEMPAAPKTVGEFSNEMMNHVIAMVNGDEPSSQAVNLPVEMDETNNNDEGYCG